MYRALKSNLLRFSLRSLSSQAAKAATPSQTVMFCYQCEQTLAGKGCTSRGVCGKDSHTSNLQDLLIYSSSGVGQLAHMCSKKNVPVPASVNKFIMDSIFSTVTNVNFDPDRIQAYIKESVIHQSLLKDAFFKAGGLPQEIKSGATDFVYVDDAVALDVEGRSRGVASRKALAGNDDLHGLQEIALYGIKGAVAYFSHAERIRSVNPAAYTEEESRKLFTDLYGLLDKFADPPKTLGELVEVAMNIGAYNLQVMKLLDQAHSSTFGIQTPITVSSIPRPGKAILVSGHDMVDLLFVSYIVMLILIFLFLLYICMDIYTILGITTDRRNRN